MLRIIRGTDCYWMIGERRLCRVPLSGGTVNWSAFERQTELIRTADKAATPDNKSLAITVIIPAGSDFDVAAVLASCERRARADGATKLDFTLRCDQPDRHLDSCGLLLTGANRIGQVTASMITIASELTPSCPAALERAGFRYVQVILDGDVAHAGRDLASLRSAATSGSSLWHVWVALTRETIGAADTLLRTLAERFAAPSLDISFALIDKPRPELAEGADLPREPGDSISDLYLLALTAGFSLRLPSCHRCAACDVRDEATGLVLNAEGMPCDVRDTRCRCATPDHLCATLTSVVRTAVRSHIYAACGLALD